MGEEKVVVIGAGPAGLAAAYELGKKGVPVVCLEATREVGGISRTVERNGYRYDLGGHRFFTKSEEVNAIWREVLGDDFLRRPRLSRIYYKQRFFNYPVKAMDALKGLGACEAAAILGTYLYRRVRPRPDTSNFEDWNINLFGDRLYKHFFKSYTEKVWGIACARIASEWGAQRIKGLSLLSTVKSAIIKPKGGQIKTLIEEFNYPRFGPGQMYTAMAEKVQQAGIPVLREHQVIGLERDPDSVTAVIVRTPGGQVRFPASHVISSMPFTDLVAAISRPMSPPVRDAAKGLTYRALLTVNFVVDRPTTVRDTWIYVHEPSLRMGRVQCFKNWSPDMVPDPSKSSLGCEYFATEGDDLWTMPDADIIDLAQRELAVLGIVDSGALSDGFVLRVPKAYPVFDLEYAARVRTIRQELDAIRNLQPVGRYGMFRYNNMDHSILTGTLAARNVTGSSYDIWKVNTDAEYHEELRPSPAAGHAEEGA